MSGESQEVDDPILRFFEGTGSDRDGRTLSDVLGFDHHELETDHRYIAWLFPTPEKSSFGFFTPRISVEAVEAFRSSPALQAKLRQAFLHILDFYGLELTIDDGIEVVEASTFSHQARIWLTEGNHNFLRISRILRSLEHLGLDAEAEAFLRYLEDLYERRAAVIGERTLQYWRLRASGHGEPLPWE